jgi:hypothetical protein
MQILELASDTDAPLPVPGLAISQLLALQVIRRSLADDAAEDFSWRDVGRTLRRAHAEMMRLQQVGIVVAEEGAILLTRHEKRLLRATSAAQIPDPALVDNLIFTLAPGREVRPFLTDAVGQLAAGLTRHGHLITFAAFSASAAARRQH